MENEEEQDERCGETYVWKSKEESCQCTVELGCWCWGGQVAVQEEVEDGGEVPGIDLGEDSLAALISEFKWENMWFEQVTNSKGLRAKKSQ